MGGRPRLPLNTWGEIRTERQDTGRYYAWAKYRDADGQTRRYMRSGDTASKAKDALKAFFADRAARDRGDITGATTLDTLGKEFLDNIAKEVAHGAKSPNTEKAYRAAWENRIQPALGGITVREMTVRQCDNLFVTLREKLGYDQVKVVRSVLSGVMAIAVHYDAIPVNPVTQARDIPRDRTRKVRALEPAEAVDLWERLTLLSQTPGEKSNNRRYRPTKVEPWIPDLVLWMLGTADRIGQAIALHWNWVNLDDCTAELGPNVIRVRGEGLRLNWGTSKTREKRVDLPDSVVQMLAIRQVREDYQPLGPVFPDTFGGLLDPTNVAGTLRRAFDLAEYDWVTSHVFRKTVATVLDDAGLSARHVADQLSHARPSMTQDVYMSRTARNPKAKEALDGMFLTKAKQKVTDLGAGS